MNDTDTTTPEGCPWIMMQKVPWANDPDWYPDFPSDLYHEVPCGEPIDPASRNGMCEWHREAMEISDLDFEARVDAGHSWSGQVDTGRGGW